MGQGRRARRWWNVNTFPFTRQGGPVRKLLTLYALNGGGGSFVTETGRVVTFEATAAEPLKALTAKITPLQAGTGNPSPENIRPITGFAGCTVLHCGKNLFDVSTYPLTQGKWINGGDGSQSNNASYASTTDFIPLFGLDGLKITLNKRPGGGLPGIAFYAGTAQNTFISGAKNNSGTAGEPMTATVPAGTRYFRFTVPADTDGVQIEIGEEATTYAAFAGKSDAITWTEAGTVYGGIMNWTTGKLTVTDGVIASYNGDELPGAWISDRDVYAAGTTPTTGAQVVYKLATPVQYTVADVPAISTLAGANTVIADTGNVTLTYKP